MASLFASSAELLRRLAVRGLPGAQGNESSDRFSCGGPSVSKVMVFSRGVGEIKVKGQRQRREGPFGMFRCNMSPGWDTRGVLQSRAHLRKIEPTKWHLLHAKIGKCFSSFEHTTVQHFDSDLRDERRGRGRNEQRAGGKYRDAKGQSRRSSDLQLLFTDDPNLSTLCDGGFEQTSSPIPASRLEGVDVESERHGRTKNYGTEKIA